MDWTEEMKEAMKAIKSACEKNDSWTKCHLCPFVTCCDAIKHEGISVPDEWGPNVDEF